MKAIAKKLDRDINARFERLRSTDKSDVIVLEAEELMVSKSGVHLGIRIGDLIFDNIHHEGVPAAEWSNRFSSVTGASLDRQSRSVRDFFGKIFLAQKFGHWFVAGV